MRETTDETPVDDYYIFQIDRHAYTYNSFASAFLARNNHLKEGKDDFNNTASLGSMVLKLPLVVKPLTEAGLDGSDSTPIISSFEYESFLL